MGFITISDNHGNELGQAMAYRVPMDYPDMPWRADPCLGHTSDGNLYAGVHGRLFKSKDEGRTWSSSTVDFEGFKSMRSFGILPDDTFLMLYERFPDDQGIVDLSVARSVDKGKNWIMSAPLDVSPYTGSPGADGNKFCMLPDGTIIVAVTLRNGDGLLDHDGSILSIGKRGIHDHIYRSIDGGLTWGDRTLVTDHCSETSFLPIPGGKLLAAIRRQRWFLYPDDPPDLWKQTGGKPGFVYKHLFLADSYDGGRTWTNLRQWTKVFGECPGELIRLNDGRILLIYSRRYPYEQGDLRARVSLDDGATWSEKIYIISTGSGYSGSVVLGDNTIVTVAGNTPLEPVTGQEAVPWRMQAVRWLLPR